MRPLERLVEQDRRLPRGVARVQQHHAHPPPAAARHSHEAAAGLARVAGLEPHRPPVAQPHQRVVPRQVQLPALDREPERHLPAAPAPPPPPPRRFIRLTTRSSAPDTCTASAIAASFPDTSRSPFISVSSRTRFPFGSIPTPEPE